MARKSKVEAEKTRTRILASALSLFVRKGYDHTTFVDIAERLKMKNFWPYFKEKWGSSCNSSVYCRFAKSENASENH